MGNGDSTHSPGEGILEASTPKNILEAEKWLSDSGTSKSGSMRSLFSRSSRHSRRGSLDRGSQATKKLGESWKKKESKMLDRRDKLNLELKFHAILRDSEAGNQEGLDRDQLLTLFREGYKINITDALFDKLFNLMDCDGNGTVDKSEFAVTMCFLLHKGSAHDRIDLAYKLFDTNKDGSISKREFSDMMSAILPPKLNAFLKVPAGKDSFKKFLDQEVAGELLKFYEEMKDMETKYNKSGIPTSIAQELVNNYIAVGSDDQVNISASERENIIEQVQKAQAEDGDKVSFSVFSHAISETVDMLENGSLLRFKQAIRRPPYELFTNLAWKVAGLKPKDQMTLKAFRRYAEKTPNLFKFLDELREELDFDLRNSSFRAFNKVT